MATQILRLPAVKARTGLGKSTLYQKISDGEFPKPVQLGERAVGWVQSDVEKWLRKQIKRSKARS